MNPLQAFLGVLLIFFLPGYFLVKALFPHGVTRDEPWDFEGALTVFLSVVLSICITIIVGTVLGFLPHGGRGYFQGAASGFPYIELSLGAVSLALFATGFFRGAYPGLGRLTGRDVPGPGPDTDGDGGAGQARAHEAMSAVRALRQRAEDLARRVKAAHARALDPGEPASARRHARDRAQGLEAERDAAEDEARRIEDEAADELYG